MFRRAPVVSEPAVASLVTKTPDEGLALAIKLARLAVKTVQPDADVRKRLRPAYEEDAEQLIAISHVVAVNFQTVAAANNYWL